MFRALLAHPQEARYKRHLVYCVRIMSVGCATDVKQKDGFTYIYIYIYIMHVCGMANMLDG
jgi:hypothetical protein